MSLSFLVIVLFSMSLNFCEGYNLRSPEGDEILSSASFFDPAKAKTNWNIIPITLRHPLSTNHHFTENLPVKPDFEPARAASRFTKEKTGESGLLSNPDGCGSLRDFSQSSNPLYIQSQEVGSYNVSRYLRTTGNEAE